MEGEESKMKDAKEIYSLLKSCEPKEISTSEKNKSSYLGYINLESFN